MGLYTGYVAAWILLNGAAAISLALLTLAAAAYVILRPGERMRRMLRRLLVGGLVARAALALYLSFGQFVTWSSTEFGRLFLPPHQPWGYFLNYAWSRYWLAFALAVLLAGLWYGFLLLVGKRSERYLDVGETELTTIAVFAAAWPGALVLAPLAGALLVLFSLVRLAFGRRLTTLGVPFLIAGFVTLAYANEIKALFGAS